MKYRPSETYVWRKSPYVLLAESSNELCLFVLFTVSGFLYLTLNRLNFWLFWFSYIGLVVLAGLSVGVRAVDWYGERYTLEPVVHQGSIVGARLDVRTVGFISLFPQRILHDSLKVVDIQNAEHVREGVLSTLLNVGTVTIYTAGPTRGEVVIEGVGKPREVAGVVNAAQEFWEYVER